MEKELLGKPLADTIYRKVSDEVATLKARGHRVHVRGVIVGNDPASIAYQNIKESAAERCGIGYSRVVFPESIDQETLVQELESFSNDPDMTGIIVQLPLPEHLHRDTILRAVSAWKDIDAFYYTLGRDVVHLSDVRPPTPMAMLKLFDQTNSSLKDQNIVVVGNGFLVGRPLLAMLRERGAEPQLIDADTAERDRIIRDADVLFTGVGVPALIKPQMIKQGVIIIDAGYAKVEGKIYGDVADECMLKARFMTPAIGGVGPLTVAILMENSVRLAKAQLVQTNP